MTIVERVMATGLPLDSAAVGRQCRPDSDKDRRDIELLEGYDNE